MDHEIVTRIAEEDWTTPNRLVVRDCLKTAQFSVKRITDTYPEFDSPNRLHAAGYLRWVFLDHLLERAFINGLFSNLKGDWLNRGGTHAYELRGLHSSLLAAHIARPGEAPADGTYRTVSRAYNAIAPSLPGFDNKEVALDAFIRINTTLVHGDKSAEFAFFRVYDDSEDGSLFTPIGSNIMWLEGEAPKMKELESEKVEEVVLRARTIAAEKAAATPQTDTKKRAG